VFVDWLVQQFFYGILNNMCLCVLMHFMLCILLRRKWPIGPFAFNKLTGRLKETVDKTSYTVTGLTAGATYEFRVAAENKAGLGPASEPSRPAAAKDTVCKCTRTPAGPRAAA